MNIYVDTEFIEDGRTIDLISIGAVREDGAEYYALNLACDHRRASPWVVENVLSHMPPKPKILDEHEKLWKTPQVIAQELRAFAGIRPQFYAYYADYDWVAICQLYGTMMQLPAGWPMYCRDIKQYADMVRADLRNVPQSREHHALFDARWVRDAHQYLIAQYPGVRFS